MLSRDCRFPSSGCVCGFQLCDIHHQHLRSVFSSPCRMSTLLFLLIFVRSLVCFLNPQLYFEELFFPSNITFLPFSDLSVRLKTPFFKWSFLFFVVTVVRLCLVLQSCSHNAVGPNEAKRHEGEEAAVPRADINDWNEHVKSTQELTVESEDSDMMELQFISGRWNRQTLKTIKDRRISDCLISQTIISLLKSKYNSDVIFSWKMFLI